MTTRGSHTIPAELRARIISYHAGVAPTDALLSDEALQRFLLHLYLPSHIDPDSGKTVVSRWVCAACEGVDEAVVRNRNYKAKQFLKRFRRDVMPQFRWGRYDMGRRPRVVDRADLDLHLLTEALQSRPDGASRRVFAISGERWTPEEGRAEQDRRRAEADATADRALCDDQRDVVLYMNARPPHAYTTAVRRHIGEAYRTAYAELGSGPLVVALRTLRAVEEHPQPFVQVSGRGRSARVYPAGLGMYGLKKELRGVLTQDWVEADLANAQLAVNAWLWECEGVLDFLQSPRADWWRELTVYLHDRPVDYDALVRDAPSLHAQVKGALKEATYAGQYGRTPRALRRALDAALPMFRNAGRRLLDHGLFAELMDSRDQHAAVAERRGHLVDAYGRRLPIGGKDGRDVNSALAEVAQSYESRLMRPVLDVAKDRPHEVQIMLWIHDGVSLRFTKGGAHEAARRRDLAWGVRQVAAAYGIPTRLVIEPSPTAPVAIAA